MSAATFLNGYEPSYVQNTCRTLWEITATDYIGASLEPVNVHGIAADHDPMSRGTEMHELISRCRTVGEVGVKSANDPALVRGDPRPLDEAAEEMTAGPQHTVSPIETRKNQNLERREIVISANSDYVRSKPPQLAPEAPVQVQRHFDASQIGGERGEHPVIELRFIPIDVPGSIAVGWKRAIMVRATTPGRFATAAKNERL